jgi:hypothetical protein
MSDADDDTPEFRSPKRCLARSFRLSRDRWKAKAAQRLQQIKALKVKARDLQASRDLWKAKALHLQDQLAQRLGVVPPPEDEASPLDHAGPTPSPTAPAALPESRADAPPKKARRARP